MEENTYQIAGYKVMFPPGKRPFSSQFAVMSKVLTALNQGTNALVESPTGTGKTLAMLCSALAWQEKMMDDLEQAAEVKDQEKKVKKKKKKKKGEEKEEATSSKKKKKQRMNEDYHSNDLGVQLGEEQKGIKVKDVLFDDDDDDFDHPAPVPKSSSGEVKIHPMMKKEKSGSSFSTPEQKQEGPNFQKDNIIEDKKEATPKQRRRKSKIEDFLKEGNSHATPAPKKAVKPPKIFFASRTHSQLAQNKENKKVTIAEPEEIYSRSTMNPIDGETMKAVSELRSCGFRRRGAEGAGAAGRQRRKLTMAVLGSREHACVNKTVRRKPGDLNDACKKQMLQARGCKYQKRAGALKSLLPEVWDIEEAARLGSTAGGCAYYAARMALPDARLVFCPYTYLIDPHIRRVLNINLKGATVIVDEAHNIEDAAREAASCRCELPALRGAEAELAALAAHGPHAHAHAARALADFVGGVRSWLEEKEQHLTASSFEQEHNVWSGEEAVAMFEEYAKLTNDTLPVYQEYLSQLNSEDGLTTMEEDDNHVLTAVPDPGRPGEGGGGLTAAARALLAALLGTARFLIGREFIHTSDYKMVVLKERSKFQEKQVKGRGRKNSGAPALVTSLCIWCFNAAVIFSELEELAHSIILTSGTLAPLAPFAGELGVPFPVRLEAGHVVDTAKQVWAAAISYSIDGVPLNAQYKYQDSFDYQDALGSTILSYCRVIPFGILVFFPSYGLLHKMHARWESTGALSEMNAIKQVFLEPKTSSDMEKVIKEYYDIIDRACSSQIPKSEGTGAVMLAVCRGKVSEGIDFSDNYARGVICVGIPYPNTKDLRVALKRRYQDGRCASSSGGGPATGSLDGSQWYAQQAFRALNQAVGRCIRHSSDFGCIILADPRFSNNRQLNGFSKWVASAVKWYRDAGDSFSSLAEFFAGHAPIAPISQNDCRSHQAAMNKEFPPEQEHFAVDTARLRKSNMGPKSDHSSPRLGRNNLFGALSSTSGTPQQNLSSTPHVKRGLTNRSADKQNESAARSELKETGWFALNDNISDGDSDEEGTMEETTKMWEEDEMGCTSTAAELDFTVNKVTAASPNLSVTPAATEQGKINLANQQEEPSNPNCNRNVANREGSSDRKRGLAMATMSTQQEFDPWAETGGDQEGNDHFSGLLIGEGRNLSTGSSSFTKPGEDSIQTTAEQGGSITTVTAGKEHDCTTTAVISCTKCSAPLLKFRAKEAEPIPSETQPDAIANIINACSLRSSMQRKAVQYCSEFAMWKGTAASPNCSAKKKQPHIPCLRVALGNVELVTDACRTHLGNSCFFSAESGYKDCIWDARDGLVYQLLLCAKCASTKNKMLGNGENNDGKKRREDSHTNSVFFYQEDTKKEAFAAMIVASVKHYMELAESIFIFDGKATSVSSFHHSCLPPTHHPHSAPPTISGLLSSSS